jgi:hypothetical protein
MTKRAHWAVKHGQKTHTFRTLREAREYAQALNAACGFDFTIISKVQERNRPLLIERELARLFTPRKA